MAWCDGATDGNLLCLALTAVRELIHFWLEFWAIIGPGGKLHPAAFLEHKGHIVIEGALVIVILYLFLQSTFKPSSRSHDELTEKV